MQIPLFRRMFQLIKKSITKLTTASALKSTPKPAKNSPSRNPPSRNSPSRNSISSIGRKIINFFLATSMLASSCTLSFHIANANVKTGYSAIVISADSGKILYEHNSLDRNYPASLTKMMTVYVAFEQIVNKKINFTDMVKVSKEASREVSFKVGFNPGDSFMLYELILATAIHSANDAATVVAEYISGSKKEFAVLMNKTAAELGMHDSHFENPHGLHSKNHYSTAQDMAKLSMALWQHFRIFFDIFSIREFKIGNKHFKSHNNLIHFEGGRGIKTGYTPKAGYSIAGLVSRKDVDLIGVVLGVSRAQIRDIFIMKLFNYIFDWIETSRRKTVVLS